MKNGFVGSGLLTVSLLLPVSAIADNSPPQVIVPQTSPAPQTPAALAPPPGTTAPAIAPKLPPGTVNTQRKAPHPRI